MSDQPPNQPAADAPKIMSTMWTEERHAPEWRKRVSYYRPRRPGGLKDLRTLWEMSRGQHALVLMGAVGFGVRYRDILLAAALKLRPGPRPRVLVTDATWEPGSRALAAKTGLPMEAFGALARLVIALIDGRHVRYGVLSSDEVATFPKVWGVDPDRVVFTPFPATIDDDTPTTRGDYVFAGGNSLRDYDLLEDAVRGTDVPVTVAARWRPRFSDHRLTAATVPHEEFVRLLAGCRASVVPLQSAVRSAGQQSYLNAMLLGKPVIVTRAPGVSDYIQDGVTGIIVDPDPQALASALAWVMDPVNDEALLEMGRAARADVLARFTLTDYFDRTLLGAVSVGDPT